MYKYSKKEVGKDQSINPNYYELHGLGHGMLLGAIEDMFPRSAVEGFYTIVSFKYLFRWKNKNGVQDLQKGMTYIKHLIHYEERCKGDDDNDTSRYN